MLRQFANNLGGGGGGGGTAASQLDLGSASSYGGAVTINLSQVYSAYLLTLDQDATITFTGGAAAKQVQLVVLQNGTGGFNLSWAVGTYYSGGVPPLYSVAANAETSISVYCDGTRTVVGIQGRRLGTAVLVAGTASISDTNVSTNSSLLYSRQGDGGTLGQLKAVRAPGTGFTIVSSSGSETSVIFWEIVDNAVSSVAPPANPLTILGANLVAWYEATDPTTLHLSAGSVTQWDDKSGNARDLTPSTVNNPTTSTINGATAVYFDNAATDESLITAANLPLSGTSQNLTFWMVLSPDVVTGNHGLIDGAVPIYEFGGTNIYLNPGGINYGGGTLIAAPMLICFQVKTSTFDNTNSLYRINGVTQTPNLTGGNVNLTASKLLIGNYSAVGPIAMKFGAMVISNNAPNLATIQSIEAYLNSLYSVY